ncbi:MAG: glycosyltransferase family 2 protein [Imperialibacter sp.]|uniref:glycosyltransferase family 2 protein n=1 Tax=Imperialibacter sp. TaxID=2038411 RepID=UPI0032ED57D9
MKITIVTVSYNSAATIERTLQSVASQTYGDIEHLIIDGASKDDTLKIVKRFPHVSQVVSEKDEGMYDAINKGLNMASGDVVGILNSDDALNGPTVISQVMQAFENDNELGMIYGDIRFVPPQNLDKTVRYYSSAHFHPGKFEWGFMPAHPSCYIKRGAYEKYGNFQIDYHIAADYELLTRFMYKHQIKAKYLPLLMVDMLTGGRSNETLKSRWVLNEEIVRGCAENGISTNMLKLSLKYFRKVFEFMRKG